MDPISLVAVLSQTLTLGNVAEAVKIAYQKRLEAAEAEQRARRDLEGLQRQLSKESETLPTILAAATGEVIRRSAETEEASGAVITALTRLAEELRADRERAQADRAAAQAEAAKERRRSQIGLWVGTIGTVAGVAGTRAVLESTAFSEVEVGVKPQPDLILQVMNKLDGYRVLRPQRVHRQVVAHDALLAAVQRLQPFIGLLTRHVVPHT